MNKPSFYQRVRFNVKKMHQLVFRYIVYKRQASVGILFQSVTKYCDLHFLYKQFIFNLDLQRPKLLCASYVFKFLCNKNYFYTTFLWKAKIPRAMSMKNNRKSSFSLMSKCQMSIERRRHQMRNVIWPFHHLTIWFSN